MSDYKNSGSSPNCENNAINKHTAAKYKKGG